MNPSNQVRNKQQTTTSPLRKQRVTSGHLVRPSRRGAKPGNALLEFVLTLPIVIFVSGLAIYMSLAMLAKQQALRASRHSLWQDAQHGNWTDLDLDAGWNPLSGAGSGDKPRGTGEELERLRREIEPSTLARTSNPDAQDYWHRLWGNLPGRQRTFAAKTFEARGSLWDFLNRRAESEYFRDSSPWHFYHIDAWKIARSGPLRPIFDSFRENLQGDVAEHFKPIRDEIIRRMFHASDTELADPDDIGTGG